MSTNSETVPQEVSAKTLLWPYALTFVVLSLVPFAFWPALLTKATSSDFLPHKYCYLNTPGLVWANVVSDAVIGISYVAIAATLAQLVHRARKDIPFSWMFLSFGLFIVACGGTHLMEVLTVWKPYYWFSADVKIVTALASASTALALPTLVPKTLDLITFAKASAVHKEQLAQSLSRALSLEQMSVEVASRVSLGMTFWEWDLATNRLTWWGDVNGVFGSDATLMQTAADVFRRIHPEDLPRVQEGVEKALRHEKEYEVEYRVIRDDGSILWTLARAQVFHDDQNRPATMSGVNIDVSARKLSEQALQQSEKLAITGRLAATIAHEINNPLASITNLNYLILHNPNATAEIKALAEGAAEELTRVAAIVRQTLGFYRESGRPIEIQFSELVAGVLALYAPQLRRKQVEVENKVGNERVIAYAGEMRQVLANLVSNAIDAVPVGGKIRIKSLSADGIARLLVVDNGPGVPKSNRTKLFEPFFTSKGEKGTGLGLWVSKTIAMKHGGKLQFRSLTGQNVHGTAFMLEVPQQQPD